MINILHNYFSAIKTWKPDLFPKGLHPWGRDNYDYLCSLSKCSCKDLVSFSLVYDFYSSEILLKHSFFFLNMYF